MHFQDKIAHLFPPKIKMLISNWPYVPVATCTVIIIIIIMSVLLRQWNEQQSSSSEF